MPVVRARTSGVVGRFDTNTNSSASQELTGSRGLRAHLVWNVRSRRLTSLFRSLIGESCARKHKRYRDRTSWSLPKSTTKQQDNNNKIAGFEVIGLDVPSVSRKSYLSVVELNVFVILGLITCKHHVVVSPLGDTRPTRNNEQPWRVR